jgi:NADPH2:quinone reductase
VKAIEMHQFGNAEVFTLGFPEKPIPLEKQVCIRIKAASFNPVDYKIRKGWYPLNPYQILGCDCSGIIESIGPNTSEFSVGDEVYAMCGSFFHCSNGSYAEYACVPVELVAKKPKSLSYEEAAAIPLAAMTAYRATLASMPFQKTNAVFVAGIGGGVGTFVAQFLKIAGVSKIYTIARDQKSAESLHKNQGIPLDRIFIYSEISLEELCGRLLKANGEKLFDITIDLIGGAMKKLCLELTGYSGHFSTIVPEADSQWDIWSENSIPRGRNLSIHQVAIGAELSSPSRQDWRIYNKHMALITSWIEQGLLKPQIENVGPLDVHTVQRAHKLLETGQVKGKLVMTI